MVNWKSNRNRPTLSQSYEWNTGKEAGPIRDFISLCQRYPKRMALACTFAISAGWITEQTIETALDPRHPNYIGMEVLGRNFVNSHYEGKDYYHRPIGYSEYLRDFYFRNPEVATSDIEKIFGIKHRGDFKQTVINIVNAGGQRREEDVIQNPEADDIGYGGALQSLIMYISLNAYGKEAFNRVDLIDLYIQDLREQAAKAPPVRFP